MATANIRSVIQKTSSFTTCAVSASLCAAVASARQFTTAASDNVEVLVTTASGLRYADLKLGDGPSPTLGQTVQVHYTGTLLDGTKFDSSRDRGHPISFPIGAGRVIKGWDEGILSMKVGGRRKLVIPPDLGYGARGIGPIPPNSVLIFDCELVGLGSGEQPGLLDRLMSFFK